MLTWFTIIPAWISNCIHYKIWGEITYTPQTSTGHRRSVTIKFYQEGSWPKVFSVMILAFQLVLRNMMSLSLPPPPPPPPHTKIVSIYASTFEMVSTDSLSSVESLYLSLWILWISLLCERVIVSLDNGLLTTRWHAVTWANADLDQMKPCVAILYYIHVL